MTPCLAISSVWSTHIDSVLPHLLMTMNAQHKVKLTWTEISMTRWTCDRDVKLNERKKSEERVILLGSEAVHQFDDEEE